MAGTWSVQVNDLQVGKFLRNSGQHLKSKGGAVCSLGSTGGWILRMASLYEVRPETIMVPFQTTDGAHQLQTIRWFRLQTGSLLGFLSD